MLKAYENILLIILEFRTDFGDIFNNVYFTIFERDPVKCKKRWVQNFYLEFNLF